MNAGESEIVEYSRPSMLPRDDVVYVKRPGIHGRRQMAVVATAAGASTDFTGQFPAHELTLGGGFFPRAILAFDCMIARKFPTCR